jgi:hypothetical protein
LEVESDLHVKMGTEREVMHLEAKEFQRLPESPDKLGRIREQILLETSEEIYPCQHLYLGLPASTPVCCLCYSVCGSLL